MKKQIGVFMSGENNTESVLDETIKNRTFKILSYDMKKEILKCISKGGVSFVELSREVPGFVGDMWIRNKKNHIYWSNISEQAAQILYDLEMNDVIKKTPCTELIYVMDGGYLPLPLVKSNRTYKKPHWLPVTWNLVK